MSEDPTQNFPASQDATLTQVLTAVQDLSGRMDRMETSLLGLEKKVDERLYDTRPIWEKVQADIAQLQEGQESLRKDVRAINGKLSVINDNLLQVQADYRDTRDRVGELERQTP